MRILIVEDDENKLNQLVSFFANHTPAIEPEIARSLRSGINLISDNQYDLIILDMSMPTFDIGVDEDGGRPQSYGGREILRQMKRDSKRTPVIVITQFDRFGHGSGVLTFEQLNDQLMNDHSEIYRGTIFYDATSEGWKDELGKAIDRLEIR